MAMVALINTASGSVPDDAEQQLRAHFGSALTRLVACDGEGLPEALDALVLHPGDVLVVWGGDGSVAAALSKASGTGASVLPLPGGTMNLLHKRVHGSLDPWPQLLDRALARADQPLAYGCVGDRRIFVALMLGKLTNLAEAREALREGAPLKAARKVVEADALDLEASISFSEGSETRWATAAAAFLPEGLVGSDLDIGLIDPEGLLDLASTGLSALITNWSDAQGIRHHQVPVAQFGASPPGDIEALLDGEPARLTAPVEVRVQCGDVMVRSARSDP